MELLEGQDLKAYVRGANSEKFSLSDDMVGRIRASFLQFVQGVSFLHQRKVLHRDLKPQNVLVTDEDRLVLLDFGLAADMGDQSFYESVNSNLVGTIPYMAPEQAAGKPISKKSDWYALGAILF